MTVSTSELLDAAKCLHGYLVSQHWNGRSILGPDSGIRFNFRIGRFIKSYLNFIPWSDDYTYMQGQAYWVLSNWLMADILNGERWGELALDATTYALSVQKPQGYWEYPNPEWKGRIATVEGCFAALALLESYGRVQNEPFLAGAKQWNKYLMNEVGFQGGDGLLAVNYFSNVPGGMVPNNSTLALRYFAKLAETTKDDRFLAPCKGIVAWLDRVQFESGELPYAVDGPEGKGRPHFLCYQYNAFEFLDLVYYYRITGDKPICRVLERLAGYLSTGLTETGAARYDCFHETPEVNYYTAAVARALGQATVLGLGHFRSLSDQAYRQVLLNQTADGGFEFFSRRNYGLFTDRRSYPRNLAMILYHLLSEVKIRQSV